MRQATRGQVLDAVHFVAPGCALGTDGALMTSVNPVPSIRPITPSSGNLPWPA
jgi:hypothetical protein